jgi:hypothetical protein
MKNWIYIFTLLLVLVACKKETTTPTTTTDNTPKGRLVFHLHTFIGESEVDAYDIDMTTPSGRTISLNRAQFYLTDIQLVKLDGSIYNVPSKGSLKVFESESVTIGDVNIGNYKSVRFKVGLIPATNKLLPTVDGYNILLNQSEMWFGNAAKSDEYVFLNFAGQIDTTKAMNGVKVPFEYRIGGNDNLISVVMPEQNITILEGQIGYAHMVIDYSKFFDNIDLTNPENLKINSLDDNKKAIVSTLKTNIASMFRYENE